MADRTDENVARWPDECERCEGTGDRYGRALVGDPRNACPDCGGTGEQTSLPGEPEVRCGGCGELLDPERGLYTGSAAYCEPCSEQVYGDRSLPGGGDSDG